MKNQKAPVARKAWIETNARGRFYVVTEGVLFKGFRNRVMSDWAKRQSARDYCKRNGLDIQNDACDLPQVPQDVRAKYVSRAETRRQAKAA